MKSNKNFAAIISIVLLVLSTLLLWNVIFSSTATSEEELSFNQLISDIEDNKIDQLYVESNDTVYEISGTYVEDEDEDVSVGNVFGETYDFSLVIPQSDYTTNTLNEAVDNSDPAVDISYAQKADNSAFYSLLTTIILLGLSFFIIRYFMKNMAGGDSKSNPGKMNAEVSKNNNLTFDDVIGYEEEKQEMQEIIDYLKNPEKFTNAGAKVPKGILLEGPPGTGKTLMAKAIAGETKIPFLPISGSDFIEMYAGVGASRVRSLFEDAKKHEKAIIFVDEIDAIGSREGKGPGNQTEHEQTINQMLTELDGFHSKDRAVIIIAATNRADKLDPALTRPGRFDRKILIGNPNIEDREKILKFHADKRKYQDVDFKQVARLTIGMSGADLESVMNEASILAVRDKRKFFDQEDVVEAIDRVQMGPAKISNKYSDRDKKFVSYHESGHAIIGLELEGAKQVEKITIVPRRYANGYVSYTPDESLGHFKSKEDLFNEIVGLLGGRTSEELFLNDITTGAENDLERATKIARAMITEYSMTDVSLTQLEPQQYKENRQHRYFSEDTNIKVDDEINSILTKAHEKAREILANREDDVHKLAVAVQEKETMTRSEINAVLGG